MDGMGFDNSSSSVHNGKWEALSEVEWFPEYCTNIFWRTKKRQWLHWCHPGLWRWEPQSSQGDSLSLQPILQKASENPFPPSTPHFHERDQVRRLGCNCGLHLSGGGQHLPGAAWHLSHSCRRTRVEGLNGNSEEAALDYTKGSFAGDYQIVPDVGINRRNRNVGTAVKFEDNKNTFNKALIPIRTKD